MAWFGKKKGMSHETAEMLTRTPNIEMTRGWKGTDSNMRCRGFQFALGEVFQEDEMELCSTGFHFCQNLKDVLKYYDFRNGNARIFEVMAYGPVKSDEEKSVARVIKFEREVSRATALQLLGDTIKTDRGRIIFHEYKLDGRSNRREENAYDDRDRQTMHKVTLISDEKPSVVETTVVEHTYQYDDVAGTVTHTELNYAVRPQTKTVNVSKVGADDFISLHVHNLNNGELIRSIVNEIDGDEFISTSTASDGAITVSILDKVNKVRTETKSVLMNGIEVIKVKKNNRPHKAIVRSLNLEIEYVESFQKHEMTAQDRIVYIDEEYYTEMKWEHDYRGHRDRQREVKKHRVNTMGYMSITIDGQRYDTGKEFYKPFLTKHYGFDFSLAEYDLPYGQMVEEMSDHLETILKTGRVPNVNELHERLWSMGLTNPVGYDYATLTTKGVALITLAQLMKGK